MFRRKKKQEPTQAEKIHEAISILSELEPRQIDRAAALAKEQRSFLQKIDAFTGGQTLKEEKTLDMEFEEAE